MRIVLTLVAASALLAACGGGSDSASADPTPTAAPQATLTSDNYVAVAQETLSSSAYLADATGLATGAQVGDSEALIRFGQGQLSKLPRWLADAPVQAVGAVQSQTENCAESGTLTVSTNDANGNGLADAGDSVSLTASNCSFEGRLLNGRLLLTVNSVTGDPDNFPHSLSVTLGFDNLATQSSSLRTVGNGGLVLSINARAANDQSLELRTSSLSLASTYGDTTYSKTLTSYATSMELRPVGSGFTTTTSANGTLSSSAFESRTINIQTLTPFVRASTQTYPSSGRLVITGAADSKVRLTATSATTVLIELDADANGSYETSTSKLWSDML